MYKNVFKRVLDLILSFVGLVILLPFFIIISLIIFIKLGHPIIFTQYRPGKDCKIFKIFKFRTMTDKCDSDGKLLSDKERLTDFGRFLRSTSLDELPELINVFIGDMSIVGPRPQLVRDMVFMTGDELRRHTVRPGITGLAQVNGRNNINWEIRFVYDLDYIDSGITFLKDLKILFRTIEKVFKRSDIATDGMDTSEDLGDYLLRIGKITKEEYDRKQLETKNYI